MKEERNIITMDGQGNISLPSDIGATAMTEREICELFGVIAPTVRAGIKALCKSGVLSIYDIKHIIRLSDKYSAEVYNLETIAALAFRVESFGAAKVRTKRARSASLSDQNSYSSIVVPSRFNSPTSFSTAVTLPC